MPILDTIHVFLADAKPPDPQTNAEREKLLVCFCHLVGPPILPKHNTNPSKQTQKPDSSNQPESDVRPRAGHRTERNAAENAKKSRVKQADMRSNLRGSTGQHMQGDCALHR